MKKWGFLIEFYSAILCFTFTYKSVRSRGSNICSSWCVFLEKGNILGFKACWVSFRNKLFETYATLGLSVVGADSSLSTGAAVLLLFPASIIIKFRYFAQKNIFMALYGRAKFHVFVPFGSFCKNEHIRLFIIHTICLAWATLISLSWPFFIIFLQYSHFQR